MKSVVALVEGLSCESTVVVGLRTRRGRTSERGEEGGREEGMWELEGLEGIVSECDERRDV